jgi:hypothetical protein
MSDPRIAPLTTGIAPARYVALGVIGKDGQIKAAYLRQQRVRHPIYSASDMRYVQGMQARLDKARAGGWGGKCTGPGAA